MISSKYKYYTTLEKHIPKHAQPVDISNYSKRIHSSLREASTELTADHGQDDAEPTRIGG